MPDHFRIFVASPSDVRNERQAIFEVCSRLPYDPLIDRRISLEIVAWDGPYGSVPLLASVDPQAAVSAGLPLPSECDVVIVVLYSRLGTPLPMQYARDGGTRQVTGTEWEYEDALAMQAENGVPDVLVYWRRDPVNVDVTSSQGAGLLDAKRQVQLVREFFERMRSQGRGYNEYKGTDEFADLLAYHLKSVIRRHLDGHRSIRNRVLSWLDTSDMTIPRMDVISFAANNLEDPHLRIMCVDRLCEELHVVTTNEINRLGSGSFSYEEQISGSR
jgi:hypothetical protein